MGIKITGIDSYKAQELANALEFTVDDMLTDGADPDLVDLMEDLQHALRKVKN